MELIAADEGCDTQLTEKCFSATTHFDTGLLGRLDKILPGAPVLDIGAGPGVLASIIPTAMLFVRSPTGISHSPEEHVTDPEAQVGAERLADVLEAILAT